ncbi:MAG: hypothetical protein PHP51_04940 [Desulfotomaculaceae bacterium]|nr:hypothetical protein [Desulfotomaculaceae bacterium]MDD4767882.1 hypothetical protein [Desulfotomaculaceae bacterium]
MADDFRWLSLPGYDNVRHSLGFHKTKKNILKYKPVFRKAAAAAVDPAEKINPHHIKDDVIELHIDLYKEWSKRYGCSKW